MNNCKILMQIRGFKNKIKWVSTLRKAWNNSCASILVYKIWKKVEDCASEINNSTREYIVPRSARLGKIVLSGSDHSTRQRLRRRCHVAARWSPSSTSFVRDFPRHLNLLLHPSTQLASSADALAARAVVGEIPTCDGRSSLESQVRDPMATKKRRYGSNGKWTSFQR